MEEIKVTELPEASQMNNDDLLMIVQSGTNKKITKSNSKFLDVKNTYDTSTTEPYSCSYVNNAIPALYDNYSTSDIDGYSCRYINELQPVVLYNSTTGGTTEQVNLSDSVANYSYIEILYRSNDGVGYKMSTGRLSDMNNCVTTLVFQHYPVNGTVYTKMREINISGTTITTANAAEYFINRGSGGTLSITDTNNIYIYRVLGYK